MLPVDDDGHFTGRRNAQEIHPAQPDGARLRKLRTDRVKFSGTARPTRRIGNGLAVRGKAGGKHRAPAEGDTVVGGLFSSRTCGSMTGVIAEGERQQSDHGRGQYSLRWRWYCRPPGAFKGWGSAADRGRGCTAQGLEREAQVARRLEPLVGLLLETVPDHALQAGWDVGAGLGDVGRFFLQNRRHRLDRGIALEGPLAGEHLVEND